MPSTNKWLGWKKPTFWWQLVREYRKMQKWPRRLHEQCRQMILWVGYVSHMYCNWKLFRRPWNSNPNYRKDIVYILFLFRSDCSLKNSPNAVLFVMFHKLYGPFQNEKDQRRSQDKVWDLFPMKILQKADIPILWLNVLISHWNGIKTPIRRFSWR